MRLFQYKKCVLPSWPKLRFFLYQKQSPLIMIKTALFFPILDVGFFHYRQHWVCFTTRSRLLPLWLKLYFFYIQRRVSQIRQKLRFFRHQKWANIHNVYNCVCFDIEKVIKTFVLNKFNNLRENKAYLYFLKG